jgi:hypothetical protein
VPSGIIVITVGNAVQIKRSCLSSVYFNYLSRIPGHAASWCQNNLQTLYTGVKTRHNIITIWFPFRELLVFRPILNENISYINIKNTISSFNIVSSFMDLSFACYVTKVCKHIQIWSFRMLQSFSATFGCILIESFWQTHFFRFPRNSGTNSFGSQQLLIRC